MRGEGIAKNAAPAAEDSPLADRRLGICHGGAAGGIVDLRGLVEVRELERHDQLKGFDGFDQSGECHVLLWILLFVPGTAGNRHPGVLVEVEDGTHDSRIRERRQAEHGRSSIPSFGLLNATCPAFAISPVKAVHRRQTLIYRTAGGRIRPLALFKPSPPRRRQERCLQLVSATSKHHGRPPKQVP
jgi:hypothetical protein